MTLTGAETIRNGFDMKDRNYLILMSGGGNSIGVIINSVVWPEGADSLMVSPI